MATFVSLSKARKMPRILRKYKTIKALDAAVRVGLKAGSAWVRRAPSAIRTGVKSAAVQVDVSSTTFAGANLRKSGRKV